MHFYRLHLVTKKIISHTQDSDEQYKLFLKKEFKLITFEQCLKYGYNNSQEILNVLENDISPQMDFPLGVFGYKLADSLAREVNFRIRQDSVYIYKNHISKNPDYKELNIHGSRVLLFCLDYYTSAELDSLTNILYKINAK